MFLSCCYSERERKERFVRFFNLSKPIFQASTQSFSSPPSFLKHGPASLCGTRSSSRRRCGARPSGRRGRKRQRKQRREREQELEPPLSLPLLPRRSPRPSPSPPSPRPRPPPQRPGAPSSLPLRSLSSLPPPPRQARLRPEGLRTAPPEARASRRMRASRASAGQTPPSSGERQRQAPKRRGPWRPS